MKRLILACLLALLGAAASAQSIPFPGPGMPAASGGGRTCVDDTASTNFLARTSGLDNPHKDAYCNFIKGMETDGLITGNLTGASACGPTASTGIFDAIYLIGTNSAANAALNICGTAYSLVAHGTPPFTVDRGYTGTGGTSPYLDTQFDPTAVSGQNWSQNSASFWGWTLTNFSPGTDYLSMGANGSGSLTTRLYPHFTDNSLYAAANQSGFQAYAVTGHFYGISRSSASATAMYVDTATTAGSTASVAPVGPTLVLLADSNTGTKPFAGVMSFGAIGAQLTTPQEANFYARVHTFMQTVDGAP